MLIILLIIGAVGAALIGLAAQRRPSRLRSVARGLLMTYTTIVLALAAGEFYFRYGYVNSHMEFGLTGRNWRERYIRENSLGYRDREWTIDELEKRETVFVVGDSFTEGWGINQPTERYPDVLASKLGEDYAVVNLGTSGYSTIHQQAALETYPYKTPDVVVWQYFLNDIDVAAKSNGMVWEVEVPEPPRIAQESYLASFLFWRLNEAALFVNIQDGRSEWEYNYAAYDNPAIWQIHAAEIDRMVEYVNNTGARLIVVIFPNMADPVGSVAYVDRVAQHLESRGLGDILKLYDAAAAWSLDERIVSRADPHASVAFNQLVGEMLYNGFFVGKRG